MLGEHSYTEPPSVSSLSSSSLDFNSGEVKDICHTRQRLKVSAGTALTGSHEIDFH